MAARTAPTLSPTPAWMLPGGWATTRTGVHFWKEIVTLESQHPGNSGTLHINILV